MQLGHKSLHSFTFKREEGFHVCVLINYCAHKVTKKNFLHFRPIEVRTADPSANSVLLLRTSSKPPSSLAPNKDGKEEEWPLKLDTFVPCLPVHGKETQEYKERRLNMGRAMADLLLDKKLTLEAEKGKAREKGTDEEKREEGKTSEQSSKPGTEGMAEVEDDAFVTAPNTAAGSMQSLVQEARKEGEKEALLMKDLEKGLLKEMENRSKSGTPASGMSTESLDATAYRKARQKYDGISSSELTTETDSRTPTPEHILEEDLALSTSEDTEASSAAEGKGEHSAGADTEEEKHAEEEEAKGERKRVLRRHHSETPDPAETASPRKRTKSHDPSTHRPSAHDPLSDEGNGKEEKSQEDPLSGVDNGQSSERLVPDTRNVEILIKSEETVKTESPKKTIKGLRRLIQFSASDTIAVMRHKTALLRRVEQCNSFLEDFFSSPEVPNLHSRDARVEFARKHFANQMDQGGQLPIIIDTFKGNKQSRRLQEIAQTEHAAVTEETKESKVEGNKQERDEEEDIDSYPDTQHRQLLRTETTANEPAQFLYRALGRGTGLVGARNAFPGYAEAAHAWWELCKNKENIDRHDVNNLPFDEICVFSTPFKKGKHPPFEKDLFKMSATRYPHKALVRNGSVVLDKEINALFGSVTSIYLDDQQRFVEKEKQGSEMVEVVLEMGLNKEGDVAFEFFSRGGEAPDNTRKVKVWFPKPDRPAPECIEGTWAAMAVRSEQPRESRRKKTRQK